MAKAPRVLLLLCSSLALVTAACSDDPIPLDRDRIRVRPALLDFGSVALGSRSGQSSTIENLGTEPVTLRAEITSDERGSFSLAQALSAKLAAGEMITVRLEYGAANSGTDVAALNVYIGASTIESATIILFGETVGEVVDAGPGPGADASPADSGFADAAEDAAVSPDASDAVDAGSADAAVETDGAVGTDLGADAGLTDGGDYLAECVAFRGWCFTQPSPPSIDHESAWVQSPTEAWVSGTQTLRFDGAAWTAQPNAPVAQAYFGTASDDLWAVNGRVHHFDGSAWTAGISGPSLAIDGTGPDDIWSTDGVGAWHYDGSIWSAVALPNGVLVYGLDAIAANDVWFAGSYYDDMGTLEGAVVHFDGSGFELTRFPTLFEVTGIWGSSATDVWMVASETNPTISGVALLRYDGFSWTEEAFDVSGYWLWGSSATDVWLFGSEVSHFDGVEWTNQRNMPGSCGQTAPGLVRSIRGVSGFAVAAGSVGTLLRHNGLGWSDPWCQTESIARIRKLWAASANEAWAVDAEGKLLRWQLGAWTNSAAYPNTGRSLAGVGVQDLWLVGSSGAGAGIWRWQGQGWNAASIPGSGAPLDAVHASSSANVWAVGEDGGALYFDGSIWTRHDLPVSADVRGVFTTSATVAWAATDAAIFRWNGQAWALVQNVASPTRSMVGTGPNDVWVSTQSDVYHWDGLTWTRPSPAFHSLRAEVDMAAIGSEIWTPRGRYTGPNTAPTGGPATALGAGWSSVAVAADSVWFGSGNGTIIVGPR